jgi:hypothetical protein
MSRGNKWEPDKARRFVEAWNAGADVAELAATFRTSRGAVYERSRRDARCQPRRTGPRKGPKPHDQVAKQRRFKGVTAEEGHTPKIALHPHHPASRKGTTFFPSRVFPAATQPRMLKSGEHSRKIGKMVTKGRWKGFPIFTLTLEERDTCPRSCLEWATCFGNNMPFAARLLDDGTLMKRLWGELAALNAEHPAGFAVRLHVLGDFYSVDYVEFWRQCLIDFTALRIFGFTARIRDDIGRALLHLAADQGDRFAMRFSGGGYETDCSEVVDRAADAIGIMCPAQSDEDRCCANCALCWHTSRTISFLRH